jgi:hypothetical protein
LFSLASGPVRLHAALGVMSHDGTSLWFEVAYYATVAAVCLVPGAAVVEVLAAAFSKRVRQYIRRHLLAHALWFVCALLLALLLFPAPSHPARIRKGGAGKLTPNESHQPTPGVRLSQYLASAARRGCAGRRWP